MRCLGVCYAAIGGMAVQLEDDFVLLGDYNLSESQYPVCEFIAAGTLRSVDDLLNVDLSIGTRANGRLVAYAVHK